MSYDNHHRIEAVFLPDGGNVDIYDDHWRHIVFVYDPDAQASTDRVLLFVDGVRQKMTVTHKGGTPTFADFNNPLTLGAIDLRGSKEAYLEGSLDEVALYLSPLSETQVMSHYRAAGEPGKSK